MRIPTRPGGYQATGDATPGTPPREPAGASSAQRHGLTITSAGPYSADVLLDGHNITHAATGLTLTMGAGLVPTVNLDLLIPDTTEIQDIRARILIPDATRDALIALGWTPPADPETEPTNDLDITPYLVVHHYRRDQGDHAWLYRCWGDGGCEGALHLDLSDRAYAERKAREHLAGHPADATMKEG